MKKKVIVIISLIIIAILIIGAIFAYAIYKENETQEEQVIGVEIVEPDRIVYKDNQENYFEFFKGDENYKEIINILKKSIISYNENGTILAEEEIDQIHTTKSFIEFDYETISKNYIIQLDENNEQAVIRLADKGGAVVSEKIKNVNKIKNTLSEISLNCKPYKLEYKEMISKNSLDGLEYKYQQQFEQINYKILQVKIDNMDDYEKYSYICNFAFEEEITQETFDDNVLILTVSSLPKIDVKVNIGNIKYTYNRIENANMQYTVHLLKVSKIVNTDCIYNTDLTELESQIDLDNMHVQYDEKVNNLDSEVFMTDYDKFLEEYEETTTTISEVEATEIADKGFEEAERICGSYSKSTQIVETRNIKPNNFFIRKYNEYDKVFDTNIECYVFSRLDDMGLNGVEIYVDKRTGKIVGGGAFGD